MNESHEVISAFLDDEPFDAGELAAALADPSGRRMLIDILALRHLVQPHEPVPADLRPQSWRGSRLRPFMAAAAVVIALVGGYLMGQSRSVGMSGAPPPTRVVQGPASWTAVANTPVRSAQ